MTQTAEQKKVEHSIGYGFKVFITSALQPFINNSKDSISTSNEARRMIDFIISEADIKEEFEKKLQEKGEVILKLDHDKFITITRMDNELEEQHS